MPIVETSMNFDLELLERLLSSISTKCPLFDERKVAETMSIVRSMQLDETKHHNAEIEFGDEKFYLGFEFFLDDIDAPDIRFWATPEFVEWLEQEHQNICEELGY